MIYSTVKWITGIGDNGKTVIKPKSFDTADRKHYAVHGISSIKEWATKKACNITYHVTNCT